MSSLLEFQRELAARDATLTGRICAGRLTEERDIGSNRVLVTDLAVISYSIAKRFVEGKSKLSIVQHMSYLDHSWINSDLIVAEDDGHAMFEADVDQYERWDGTTSYGFVKLHKLASLCLNMAQALYYSNKSSLEDAYLMTCSFIDHLSDAIDENKNQCLIYMNPYLLSILLNEHYDLKQKYERKHEISEPKPKLKRNKRKGFNTL